MIRRLASFSPLLAGAWVAACSSGASAPNSDVGYSSCPTDAPTTCPATVPSFANEVEPIIEKTCALGGQCHGPGGAEESMYNYTSYAGIKKNYLTMETELLACAMPPSDAVAPSPADWLTMATWFVCGAPNN